MCSCIRNKAVRTTCRNGIMLTHEFALLATTMDKLLVRKGVLKDIRGCLQYVSNICNCHGRRNVTSTVVGVSTEHDKTIKNNLHTFNNKGTYFCRNIHTKTQGLREERLFRREIHALIRTLERSDLLNNRHLSTLPASGHVRHFHKSAPTSNREEDEGKKGNDEDKVPFMSRFMFWFWVIFVTYSLLRFLQREESGVYRYISWNEFYHDMLSKGEVARIEVRPEMELAIVFLYEGAILKGKQPPGKTYIMKIPEPHKFEERIRKAESELGIGIGNGVPLSFKRENTWIPMLVFLGIISIAGYYLFRKGSKLSLPNPTEMFSNERKAKFVRVDNLSQQGNGVSFKDVAGMKEAKMEIMEFVEYLKAPQRFKDLGAKVPRGALLLGPPGCGKTLLAKAVATEAKVPFLAMAGSEFVEMLRGLGAARVRDLFKEARKRAPCIIYLDEIDAVGKQRSGSVGGANEEGEQTLNQLLVEMDGIGTQEGVIILASTNRSDILDKALLRPGRFDRHITIDLPTLIERHETFDMYIKRLKTAKPAASYSTRLSQLSPGMSGADIANICNEAALHAARVGKKIIETSDFEYAVERVIAGVAKKTGTLSPSEKKVVAYHESGHVLIGWLLKHTDALIKVSIVPRTSSALGFAQYIPSDQKLYSTEELFDRMCMALGGRVAEAVIFNHVTTGAEDDLKKVTQLAYNQIRSYGMNDKVGPLSFPSQKESGIGKKPYSKLLANIIDEEARSLVSRAYKTTEAVLESNKDKLHTMAKALLDKEVLNYSDIEDLIGAPPHGKKNAIALADWDPSVSMEDDTKDNARDSPS